jgi:8-oxo-dGTP diphosphatase
VVAAAIVRDARVLAARRVRPVVGWEFPGGKVEPGETVAAAIERECREELGVGVHAVRQLATTSADTFELLLWQVSLATGEPTALEAHDELRWVGVDELEGLDWLPADRDLLDIVRGLL